MTNLMSELADNVLVKIIAVVIVVIIIAVGAIASFGFLAAVILAFLVGITAFFGSIRHLAGGALIAALLGMVGGSIEELLLVWFGGNDKVEQSFAIVDRLGFFELTIVLFAISFTISFFTGSVKILSFVNTVNVQSQKEDG